ncbi:peptidase U32 family protein [Romboutsia sp.]|uniref:peptidase U32 family protein n=1 Tax=Romboutsia sp. TaxID=1965302 RepID=UPI002CAC740C|nr:peptidase U32 family protein [Romboutsia sp.]HSQ88426.1 peptidase U32 family protein [Romboutsia sp.]
MHNVELLAPARDLEELKINIDNGADAVYIGGEVFGMVSQNKDFSKEQMVEGIDFAHKKGSKVYVAVNIIPHNEDFIAVENYLKQLEEIGVDAVLISDPGMLNIVKNTIPKMEIHLSDQANTTNYVTAKFWHEQGIKRIVASRELSCEEIAQIRAKTPLEMDIEVFVHGTMTLSYSGRRLISNYITDQNLDKKINKKSYNLVEEKRPGEYFPVYEDERGTFLFNSQDLCMIEYIPQLIKAGIKSFKIEGKMKDSKYVEQVVKAYRAAIDEFYKNPQGWEFNPMWLGELKKISDRQFTAGFYLGNPCDKK